jgi:DNA-damage-inducible protein D
VAKTGGGIAKKARLELERKSGRRVVSAENYLPPSKKKLAQKKELLLSGKGKKKGNNL